jgi:hypothetical protein
MAREPQQRLKWSGMAGGPHENRLELRSTQLKWVDWEKYKQGAPMIARWRIEFQDVVRNQHCEGKLA